MIDSRYFFSISLCGCLLLVFAGAAFVDGAGIGSGDEDDSDDVLLPGRFLERVTVVGSATSSCSSSLMVFNSAGEALSREPVMSNGSGMAVVLGVSRKPAPSLAFAKLSSHWSID